jgi:hypothetical protein
METISLTNVDVSRIQEREGFQQVLTRLRFCPFEAPCPHQHPAGVGDLSELTLCRDCRFLPPPSPTSEGLTNACFIAVYLSGINMPKTPLESLQDLLHAWLLEHLAGYSLAAEMRPKQNLPVP